jgi:hypothetical protein
MGRKQQKVRVLGVVGFWVQGSGFQVQEEIKGKGEKTGR